MSSYKYPENQRTRERRDPSNRRLYEHGIYNYYNNIIYYYNIMYKDKMNLKTNCLARAKQVQGAPGSDWPGGLPGDSGGPEGR